jgi:hypothetical protein
MGSGEERRKSQSEISAMRTIDEIMDASIPEPNTGCWIWLRALDRHGYGNVYWRGRHTKAHRAAYEAIVGPIPTGMNLCHRCDNPICINPQHMFIGTQQDNLADMTAKDRRFLKLTDEQVARILSTRGKRRYDRRGLASELGVSVTQISRVRRTGRRS